MIFEYTLFGMICSFIVGVFCGKNHVNHTSGYQPDSKNNFDSSKPPKGGSGVPKKRWRYTVGEVEL